MNMEQAIQELEYTRDKMIEAATTFANQWLKDMKAMIDSGTGILSQIPRIRKIPLSYHIRWAVQELRGKPFTTKDIVTKLADRFPINSYRRKANLSSTLRLLAFGYKELVVLKPGHRGKPSVYQVAKIKKGKEDEL